MRATRASAMWRPRRGRDQRRARRPDTPGTVIPPTTPDADIEQPEDDYPDVEERQARHG